MDTWSNLCRCCLSPESTVSFCDKGQNVKEKFLEITSLEVNPDDGLPQKLCQNCYSVLKSAYQFRKQCIKMDNELKLQMKSLLLQVKEDTQNNEVIDQGVESLNNNQSAKLDDPMKQLESLIKREPIDSDDECYYVLVIDDPKDKENEGEKENVPVDLANVKLEIATDNEQNEPTESTEPLEPAEPIEPPAPMSTSEQKTTNGFDNLNSIDLFIMSNTKVPVNVPATILENEEESQDNEEHFGQVMDVDNPQDENSQDSVISGLEEIPRDDNQIIGTITQDFINDLPNSKNFVKIMTSASSDGNGTIVLKTNEGLQYLTGAELIASNDSEQMDQEEQIIFCEGDESSQYQIVRCDGTELVIEYSDDGQIATVLQQEDGSFLCDCGEQFADLELYEKHQHEEQHKPNPSSEHCMCELCGRDLETPEVLAGHMLLHKYTGLMLACPFCNQLIRRNALTQHIKYSHNLVKPRCNVCFKTFANPNNLKRHQMIHNGIRDYECDICAKRFHQKITMQTHRLTHANLFSCHYCDKTFAKKSGLVTHRENDCALSSPQSLVSIKEELMKTVKKEVTTDLGKLLGYACSLCKKMFSVESALEKHVESVHMVDPIELLCSECGEVLPSRKDMQIHMMLSHKDTKSRTAKRFECTICGKGCSSQAMLIMHERVHTNERPFPCQLCSLRFKTKTHLRTHQLTHTREKKFGCSVCMKFFALKGNLVVHLRTHTGERPYICTICNEAFIDSKYLKKHKVKKHSIDNVPWHKY